MVLLTLTPLKGNHSSSRGWPFSGYLGLTHISIHGTVRTRLGDDRSPLLASQIAIQVRCYESRLAKFSGGQTNVLVERSQVLWTPLDSEPYGPVGDLDLPFRFVLPPDLPGPSHDAPSSSPSTIPYSLPSTSTSPHLSTPSNLTTGHFPSCSYSLSTPANAVGPEDPVPVTLRVRPAVRGATVTRVSASIERRMDFRDQNKDTQTPSTSNYDATPLPTPPSTASSISCTSSSDEHTPTKTSSRPTSRTPTPSKGKAKELNLDLLGSSVLRATKRTTSYFFSSSSSTPTNSSPLSTLVLSDSSAPVPPSDPTFAFSVPTNPRSQPTPSNVVKTTVQSFVSTEKAKHDIASETSPEGVVWVVHAPMTVPTVKTGHWAMGETMDTPLVRIKFVVSVKVTLSIPVSPTESITETVVLPPQELHVVAISVARRIQLLAKVTQVKSSKAPKPHPTSPSSRHPHSHSVHLRRLRSSSSRRHLRSPTHPLTSPKSPVSSTFPAGPSLPTAPSVNSNSKKRHRTSDSELLPSPPPSPVMSNKSLTAANTSELTEQSSMSSTVPLVSPLERPPRISPLSITTRTSTSTQPTPPCQDEDMTMESPLRTSGIPQDTARDSEDVDEPFMLTGDLTFRRIPKRKPAHVLPTSTSGTALHLTTSHLSHASGSTLKSTATSRFRFGRSAKLPKPGRKAVEDATQCIGLGIEMGVSGPLSPGARSLGLGRRPTTSDGPNVYGSRREEFQRASSVGAVSPTGVLLLTEGISGLMDIVDEDETDNDPSPFSFAPPPPLSLGQPSTAIPTIKLQPAEESWKSFVPSCAPSPDLGGCSPASVGSGTSAGSGVTLSTFPAPPTGLPALVPRSTVPSAFEREWEAELGRIETSSRMRSEDFVRFFGGVRARGGEKARVSR
ncbi:hypothetical protein FRB99_007483 [Tulasnella sp. 403]|nr:hypothetical protein FRB99_007483 [Tulasnella sp. 403]